MAMRKFKKMTPHDSKSSHQAKKPRTKNTGYIQFSFTGPLATLEQKQVKGHSYAKRTHRNTPYLALHLAEVPHAEINRSPFTARGANGGRTRKLRKENIQIEARPKQGKTPVFTSNFLRFLPGGKTYKKRRSILRGSRPEVVTLPPIPGSESLAQRSEAERASKYAVFTETKAPQALTGKTCGKKSRESENNHEDQSKSR